MSANDSSLPFRRRLRTHVTILGVILALMWGLELVDFLVLNNSMNEFGVQPRSVRGLLCIPVAPFLHGNLEHIAANSLPFLILGWAVMLRSTRDFFFVTTVAVLISGLGTWLIASTNSSHIGASGVIFGYFGFLTSRAYFERSLRSMLVAVVVGLLYGGLIWGVLPTQEGISWQGHLFGFLGGVVAARLLSRKSLSRRK